MLKVGQLGRRDFIKGTCLIAVGIVEFLKVEFFSASWLRPAFGEIKQSTYYVDAINGNDKNTGLKSSESWKTMKKVNGREFKPGDRILFRRGQTFRDEILSPRSHGTAIAPITFGAYGDGAQPRITYSEVLSIFKKVGPNLWATKVARLLEPKNEIRIARDLRDRSILRGRRNNISAVKRKGDFYCHVSTSQLFIHSLRDPSNAIEISKISLNGAVGAMRKEWLNFQDLHFDLSNRRCLQIIASHQVVRRCTLSNGADGGSHTFGKHVDDCRIEDTEVFGCGGNGILVNGGKVTRDKWTIRNNNVHDNCLDFIGGREVPHNFTAGIKVFCLGSGRGLVIEGNRVYQNGNVHQKNKLLIKGIGIWVDTWPKGGASVRFNRVWQNVNAGIKVELTEQQKVYCNVVYENGVGRQWINGYGGKAGVLLSRGAHNNMICHNTIYNNAGPQIALQGPRFEKGKPNDNFSNGNIIKNNIAIFTRTDDSALQVLGGKVSYFNMNVITKNCFGPQKKNFIYWGVLPTAYNSYEEFERVYERDSHRQTTHSIKRDPHLMAPEEGDFHLKDTSPVKNMGDVIPFVTHDYDGDKFGNYPSVGAFR